MLRGEVRSCLRIQYCREVIIACRDVCFHRVVGAQWKMERSVSESKVERDQRLSFTVTNDLKIQ